MPEETVAELTHSLRSLERKNRLLTGLVLGFAVVGTALVLGMTVYKSRPPANPAMGPDGILRVRGISVVDERGTERIYIGAPVREPLILGKRFPRGGGMSGILLFDEDGTERSGYCTSDGYPNVLFTLDSIGSQHALFMAEPQGDTAFWIWNGQNSCKVTVGETEAGLKISKDGKAILEVPAAEAAKKGGAR
jgi:hypothetical protein